MIAQLWQKLRDPQAQPFYLILIALLSSLALYLPFYFKDPTILMRHWDGPNYMYVAKTLYNIPESHPFTAYDLPPRYFACHLPLYPLLIRLFVLVGLSYPAAMFGVTLMSTCLASYLFYLLLQETGIVKNPFWSALVALFLPARWLMYHSIGATEPLFLVLVLASMLSWLRGRYALAMLFVGLGTITRIVGALFAVGYLGLMLWERRWKQLPLLALTPLPLLAVFAFYHYQFGDFWAYFHWNAKLLNPVPMQVLVNYAGANVPHSAELYLGMYSIYAVGVVALWRLPIMFWYALPMFIFNLFIFHEDLSRYFLPIAPFALIVAYDDILSSRRFQMVFPLVVAGVYFYAWGLLPHNVLPEHLWKDLAAFLSQAP